MISRSLLRLLSFGLFAVLCGCSHRGTSDAPRRVRVALSADAISWLPIRLAQTFGYASKEGITIEISNLAGLSKGMEALLGGSVDVSAGGLLQAIQVAARGRAVRCFLTLYSRPTEVLAVAPSMTSKIRTIGDLKGRRVGVSSPGSPTHQFLNFLLASHGSNPTEVSIVAIGTGAASLAALEHATVDAAVLVGSGINVFERRYPNASFLADTRTEEGTRRIFGTTNVTTTGLDAREEWLRENSETVRRFVRAVKKGMEWVVTHSAEEVRGMIPEGSRMPDAEADLEAIRQIQRTMSPDGMMPPDAPQAVLKYLAVSDEKVRNARIDLPSLYTNEFTQSN